MVTSDTNTKGRNQYIYTFRSVHEHRLLQTKLGDKVAAAVIILGKSFLLIEVSKLS